MISLIFTWKKSCCIVQNSIEYSAGVLTTPEQLKNKSAGAIVGSRKPRVSSNHRRNTVYSTGHSRLHKKTTSNRRWYISFSYIFLYLLIKYVCFYTPKANLVHWIRVVPKTKYPGETRLCYAPCDAISTFIIRLTSYYRYDVSNYRSAFLSLCEGNPPVTSGLLTQTTVTWKRMPLDEVIMVKYVI